MPSEKWRRILDTTATCSVIAACAAVIWLVMSIKIGPPPASAATRPPDTSPAPLPSEALDITDLAIMGSSNAKVGVIEYSDFECPFCRKFATETLPRLTDRYVITGQAFFGFRHLPLELIHPSAVRAAEAAECARRQDRFWQVHDLLFAPPALAALDLATISPVPQPWDAAAYQSCLGGPAREVIRRDMDNARRLGIRSTPTFLFGARDERGGFKVLRRESGALPFEAFAAILDEVASSVR